MEKKFLSPRLQVMACFALILVCLGLTTSAFAAGPAPAQSASSGPPRIWLQDNRPVQVAHVGPAAASMGTAQPLSMVSVDFDADGVEDLVVGYSTPNGGVLAIHRGNLDAFAPQSDASFQAIARGKFPQPFLPEAQTLPVSVIPDFIAAGDFTGHGNTDLAVAARDGNTIYIYAGDGTGHFSASQTINLPGGVTSLAADAFGSMHVALIVGVANASQAFLAVYGSGHQGLTPLAAVRLNSPVSSILFGDFGDPGPDVAFLSGGKISILRSSSMKAVQIDLPVTVRAFALGSFIYDRNNGPQIAVLASDGSVQIAARSEFDPRVYSVEEFGAIRRAKIKHEPAPAFVPHPSFPANGWKIVEGFPSVGAIQAGQPPVFLRTRISINGADDILWLNASSGKMVLISHGDGQPGASTFAPGQVAVKAYSGTPLAAFVRRLNVDGRLGVVALHQGETTPSLSVPIPDPNFFVNTDNDPTPTSPIANACTCTTDSSCFTNLTASCSLREAILKANGDTIMLQAGHTYSLTRGRVTATPDYTGDHGALYVNNTATIVGGNQNTTIIQWGTLTSGDTVDMVMAVNEDISPQTNATASLSNLTIQGGVNHGSQSGFDGDGGCMEFDTGTSGTATLSLTSVILQNCSTLDGGGGGLVIFNFLTPAGAGGVTISNSIIQGNSVVGVGAAGNGGGIAINFDAHMTMTASQVINNSAVQQCTPSCGLGAGGGILSFAPQNVSAATAENFIHSSTISGNKAAGFGAGINSSASLSIDQGTVISGNIAGTDGSNDTAHANQEGSGLYSNPAASCPSSSTCTTTLSKVTITGNKATGNGGGVSHGNNSAGTTGTLTMSFSRLAGNTTSGGSGSNLSNNHATATVTDNWWGTNNASSTINTISGTTTFDPFIVLTNTANPSTVNVNASTTLTASFLQDNHGTAISASNLDVLLGLPVTWGNAILGSLSNQQTSIDATGCPGACAPSAGTATATFTAGPTSLPGPQPQAHADATVDNGTATADITIPLPPAFSKSFGAASIPLNGSTSLSFTLQNNNAVSLSNIAFSDTLPAGLIISTPNGQTGTCGGGTITATQGTNVVSLSGATLAASASCTFSVNVTGTAAGLQTNTTGNVSATESGSGGVATASLSVLLPPVIAKVFNPSTIAVNATTSLTFTITNQAANADPLAGLAFSDTLPAGLVVSTPNGLVNNCGGTATATAGGTSISLTGGTVAVNSSCTVVVNITGTASGQYTNTSGAVSSTNGGTGNTASANLTVASPPTSTKQFTLHQIPLNGITTLTISITNPNTNVILTGVAFTDSLPAGLVVASTPNLSNTCGGTATATGGSGSMSLSGGTLAASASCTVSVSVQGTTGGVKINSVTVTSTEAGAGTPSTDSITVAGPPVIIKAFGAASVALNGTTSLTFTIQNNNTTVGLSGVAFSDTLPAGLIIATPNGLSGSCGAGTITATQNTNVISLSGGTIAASSSCTFAVNVKGTAAGTQNNTTGNVSSTESGTGGTASASVNVDGPPAIAKAFNPVGISPNGTSTVTITITNPAANPDAAAGVAFTDVLPPNLVVATPNGLTNACGGTATATAGSGTVTLTGGSIPTNSSCTVTVNVTATPTGSYVNITGAVSSTNGGTGGTASATLFVARPPTISKVFVPDTTVLGGSAVVSFTITNSNCDPNDPSCTTATPPDGPVTLTGIGFSDTLPANVKVAASSPIVNNDCGGTVTAVPGSNSITLTGGSLAPAVGLIARRRAPVSRIAVAPLIANGQCFVSVKVTPTATGTFNNTTGPISANESGLGAISNTATLTVNPPPVAPTLVKAFGAASVPLNGTTSLTFTVTNPGSNTVVMTNISFNDTLPSGLLISNPNGLAGTCVGSADITANAGSNAISMVALSLNPAASCSFSINVDGTSAGTKNNTTSNITAAFDDGTGNFIPIIGGTASASIAVVAPPSIAKAFNPALIAVNGTSSLTFTITNPATNTVAEAGVAFTDTLPANVVVATPNGAVNNCGGTVTATAGSGSISLTGGTVAVASNCTISVNVTSAVAGNYTNTTGAVSSTNGGTGNTASASLTVQPADLTITKTHTDPFQRGQTGATYTITVKNIGAGPTIGTVTVVDTLPNVPDTFVPTAMTGTGWTCNLGTLTCTRSDVLAPGASYPAITLTVNVPINIQANVTNTAKVSGGGETNTGNDTATDPTHIGAPIQITFANSSATVTRGQSATFPFTLDSSPGLGTVTFSSSGVPAGALCTFNPPSSSLLTDTINMNCTTSGPSASAAPIFPGGLTYALLFPALGVVGLVFAGSKSKKNKKTRLRWVMTLSGLSLLLALADCGGRPHFNGTPPGSYTITVTATAATASGSGTVTLNVQ